MDIKQLLAKFKARRARPRDRRDEKGFTMAEVLLSIIVFTISVVGVVAMQRASIAAESSAAVLREGQRIGANEMEAMLSRSFNDLVEHDFDGNPSPAYPFDDMNQIRTFPYRGVPMDVDWNEPFDQ